MIKYIKPKASCFDETFLEVKNYSITNPDDDYYVVIPNGVYGIFVKDNRPIAIETQGTYDARDYDADCLYFYFEEKNIGVTTDIRKPLTAKCKDGKLNSMTFRVSVTYTLKQVSSKTLEFFEYRDFYDDDMIKVLKEFILKNYKRILAEFSSDGNQCDDEYHLQETIQKMYNEYLSEFGLQLKTIYLGGMRLNDPTFFEDEVEDVETRTKNVRTEKIEKEDSSFIDGVFSDMFKDLSEGKSVNKAKSEAESKILGDLFSSFLGKK